jgi:hypothetical protein
MAEEKQDAQLTDTNTLPPNVEEILYSDAGNELNESLADDFDLVGGQVARVTILISDLFHKKAEVRLIDKLFSKELEVKDPETVKNLVIAILGKKLLILDNEWFDGKVADKLKAMGGNPDDYVTFIAEFKAKIAVEKQAKEDEKRREAEELAAEKKAAEEVEQPLVITDPEKEKASTKKTFASLVKGILQSQDYKIKLDLNARLVILLAQDEDEKFQKELMDILYENKEMLTTDRISLRGAMVDPTIGNWLADFIRFVGNDEVSSTIKRAQYITDSENPKKLNPEELELLKKLLEFFVGLKNFYINASRLDFEDIKIIPLSHEEEMEWEKEKSQAASGEKEIDEEMIATGNIDIAQLYAGNEIDNKKIDEEKQRIIGETRSESNKVADIFEDCLLQRKKHSIVACMEILAETNAFDNILAKDPRFVAFLVGYFKRNNLAGEVTGFQTNPYQEKYIRYFLKYVFGERLGLLENEAARYATRLAGVFHNAGSPYTQLAYLDLADYKFKWSE